MKKIINFILLCVSVYFTSCEPQRYCNEPKCAYSDVSTNITAYLSGNIDSIISIGDTLVFEMNIPDTIMTNGYGSLVIKQLKNNSFFGINCGTSLILNPNNEVDKPKIIYIESSNTIHDGKTIGIWNYSSHHFKVLFIFDKIGNYVLELIDGRIELIDHNNKEWLIMPNQYFENSIDRHPEMFISWFPDSLKTEARQVAYSRKNTYYLEVR